MPSQEGGVNIYAVIWNIMLFCMILPYAYVCSGSPLITSLSPLFGSRFTPWRLCALRAKMCVHAAAVVVAVGWDI